MVNIHFDIYSQEETFMSATKKPAAAFTDNQNIVWVIITGTMAFFVVVLMFFPQNLGVGITSVFSLMLWWGLFGLFLFKYINKKGVIGFISGSVVGLLLHIFEPIITSVLV